MAKYLLRVKKVEGSNLPAARILFLLLIQSSPLIWSTDVRSTRLYGQFLTGPNHQTLILIMLVWSIFIGQNADLTSGLDCNLILASEAVNDLGGHF